MDNPDVVCITETWWNDVSMVSLSGFTLYRFDRASGAKNGGVCIYIRNTISSSETKYASLNGLEEQSWCEVHVGTEKILIGCVYRAESRTGASCIAINETLLTVSKLVSISYDSALICGDFNYHQIKWTSEGITHIDGPMDSLAYQFASTLDECHFNQAVTNPT